MKLEVLKYPNKKLKKKSRSVSKVNQVIQDLARDMFETMYLDNGIGLAAPQVGELIRLIILDVALIDPDHPEDHKPDPVALVNPEIEKAEGTIEYEEGCLSCPELIVPVTRSEKVWVNYLDLDGKPSKLTAEGLKAVCIQHEIDHLDGILLVDKMGRLEKDMYRKKRIRVAKDEKALANIL
ncbi:MAG: peptide deformylase [Deltaproteobacteria bacterium RIFCSPLOWO2_12_FULL_40_28]|nr:MAG: peptide deformylase [Deltaproteobacteria bacterium RIFCSPHIGHO2_02_FULL_40_28]OGQ19110.1 MAG: peptide deformylase [Deltaproteobacteria bacterium RIFCSPHIGHO2_12_FULL_40_32]OGQ40282.1 MAG: peptide deformylase [Deltaproteobacteria bacterium RIFCSPLOWO2_02_FULL_40_36]OGQ53553.1 MAG: peptide deformylase [Deltaproteobacteria bacterium RIFCSPLOWO2_12_FULL_40_28]